MFLKTLGVPVSTPGHADDFFRGIGAEPLIAMDASNYEGAAIIHDMNEPVDEKYHGTFDTVIDGGTLEHVFNFPVAIRNCMQMVKVGGQLILMTPWHNFPGHGFYQFSPELIHNTLSIDSGYSIEKMLIVAGKSWYSVKNPSELKNRIEISTRDPILLYVTARRIAECPVLSSWPQQSDYTAAWQSAVHSSVDAMPRLTMKSRLVEGFPPLESLRSKWRDFKHQRAISPARNPGLVRIGPSWQNP